MALYGKGQLLTDRTDNTPAVILKSSDPYNGAVMHLVDNGYRTFYLYEIDPSVKQYLGEVPAILKDKIPHNSSIPHYNS